MRFALQPARHRSSLETLESRIAPAAVFVNATTATYNDHDGDHVTVHFSKPVLTAGNVGTVFTFNVAGDLSALDLTAAAAPDGTGITFTVAKVSGGDGLANIGRINATGFDLGAVTVKGDLGRIDAGSGTAGIAAVKSLTVRSIGRLGLDTEAGGSLESDITGALGALAVTADVKGAFLHVIGTDGSIGAITIGGSIIGGATASSGEIFAEGDIGLVKIGHDIVGGAGMDSGLLKTNGKLAGLSLAGSLIGGSGGETGLIYSIGDMGVVTIGHDLQAGAGNFSARIEADGTLKSVNVGGSLIGSGGFRTAQIYSIGNMGLVKIGHDLQGGTGGLSAVVQSFANLAGVSVGGSIIGGAASGDGEIFSQGDMGLVTIAHDVRGGAGVGSGYIDSLGKIAAVTIGGSLVGGSNANSGEIDSTGDLGAVKIGHDLQGGSGADAGYIHTAGKLTSVRLGGSLIGGTSADTGAIFSKSDLGPVTIGYSVLAGSGARSGLIESQLGTLGAVTLGGSLVGGAQNSSGQLFSSGDMGLVKIGHSVWGGGGSDSGHIESLSGKIAGVTLGGSLVGGAGSGSGVIVSGGDLGAVKIGHNLTGGSISGSVSLDFSGVIESTGGRIASVFIGGSIVTGVNASTGTLTNNATIRAAEDLGSLTVNGSLIGNAGDGTAAHLSPVVITARGQAIRSPGIDLAIGHITIGGRVEFANLLAGYDPTLAPVNGDAQIGAVKVTGDWAASNLVAGAMNLGADDAAGGNGANADNVNFGDAHDVSIGVGNAGITAKIASITIAGQVFGTPGTVNSTDHFGFVAEQIGPVKISGSLIIRPADLQVVGETPDVTIHTI